MSYNTRILTYRDDWNEGVKTMNGVGLVTLNSGAKPLRLIGFPLHYYVLRNRKSIDCLILYFAGLNHAITSVLFRLFNRRGICIIKMDSNGILYDNTAYKHNLVKRIFLRSIGELTFRILSCTADLFIIESPEARQRVLGTHPWLKHKLIMLPNGVNQKRFGELS
jgi:hypothetical protein